MATFFDAIQRRILKYVWVPVIVYLLFYLFSDIHQRDFYAKLNFGEKRDTDYIASVLLIFPFVVAVGYEFFMRKKYKEILLMVAAAIGSNALIMLDFHLRVTHNSPAYGITAMATALTTNGLLLLLRAHLLGYDRLQHHALISLIITYFTSTVATNIFGFVNAFHHMSFWWREVITLPFRALLPFFYFMGLLLSDNLAASNTYLEKLKSKVQVISSKEYFVLYCFLINVAIFGAVGMGWNVGAVYNNIFGYKQFETTFVSVVVAIILALGYAVAIAAAGYVLRNIIISRMMTIGSDNGWMYAMHYSFMLNIIPVICWMIAEDCHETEEENAYFYLSKQYSSVGTMIMIMGGLFSCISAWYILMTARNYREYGGYPNGIALICVVSAFMHIALKSSKTPIYWILSLNALSTLFFAVVGGTGEGLTGIMFVNIYLSFFVLMEIFHPSLNKYQLEEDKIPEGIPAE